MEYYKNLSLESVFYINYDGLVCLEEWRDIPNYEGLYQVSDLGRVKSLCRDVLHNKNSFEFRVIKGRILKQIMGGCGRLDVKLSIDGKIKSNRVHVLVAIAFLNHKPDRFKIVVDHKNNIRTHNYKTNLQLITHRHNLSKDQFRRGKTSIYTGVYLQKGRWAAYIYFNNKRYYLGRFKRELDASNAYQNKLTEINSLENK